MMSTLWIIILGVFALATDYTVQNNHIPKLDITPQPKMERNVIHYETYENFGMDGMHTTYQDSIVYYEKKRKRNRS